MQLMSVGVVPSSDLIEGLKTRKTFELQRKIIAVARSNDEICKVNRVEVELIARPGYDERIAHRRKYLIEIQLTVKSSWPASQRLHSYMLHFRFMERNEMKISSCLLFNLLNVFRNWDISTTTKLTERFVDNWRDNLTVQLTYQLNVLLVVIYYRFSKTNS